MASALLTQATLDANQLPPLTFLTADDRLLDVARAEGVMAWTHSSTRTLPQLGRNLVLQLNGTWSAVSFRGRPNDTPAWKRRET